MEYAYANRSIRKGKKNSPENETNGRDENGSCERQPCQLSAMTFVMMEGRILLTLWGYPRLPRRMKDTAKASMLRSKTPGDHITRTFVPVYLPGLQIVTKTAAFTKAVLVHQDFQVQIKGVLLELKLQGAYIVTLLTSLLTVFLLS